MIDVGNYGSVHLCDCANMCHAVYCLKSRLLSWCKNNVKTVNWAMMSE